MTPHELRGRIQVAKKERPADLVLKGGRLLNLYTAKLEPVEVAVAGGFIAALGEGYSGQKDIHLRGEVILPGFIDAHIHIESSMLHPLSLACSLLPHGTTSIVCDPHEIANVMGIEGILFLIKQSEDLPFDIYFMAPSCVPATELETAGAHLGKAELTLIKAHPRVLGLAEVMNFPGLVEGNTSVVEKVALFQDKVLDGHCPGLTGELLQAYLCTGIGSDHETITKEEAAEKVASGMVVMIREGSTAKNMEVLLPLVNAFNVDRFCLVSDDLSALDIIEKGHLDFLLKKAVGLGLDPALAIRMVTRNPSAYFGLRHLGAVAPGYKADLVVVDDLSSFRVRHVFKSGRHVVSEGELVEGGLEPVEPQEARNSVHIGPLSPASFSIPFEGGKARIIGLLDGQIYTKEIIEEVKVIDGKVVAWPERDILKLAVVERHTASGRIGLGLLKGLGLKRGAVASSIAHDSHNLIVVGVEERDMFKAAAGVREMGGGIVVVKDGAILSSIRLEIGGLMTFKSAETVARQLRQTKDAIRALGSNLPDPVMAISFLALPVIPELKLTDRGLVDVDKHSFVPLFVKES